MAFGGIAFGVNPTIDGSRQPAAFRKAVRRCAKNGGCDSWRGSDQPTASYQYLSVASTVKLPSAARAVTDSRHSDCVPPDCGCFTGGHTGQITDRSLSGAELGAKRTGRRALLRVERSTSTRRQEPRNARAFSDNVAAAMPAVKETPLHQSIRVIDSLSPRGGGDGSVHVRRAPRGRLRARSRRDRRGRRAGDGAFHRRRAAHEARARSARRLQRRRSGTARRPRTSPPTTSSSTRRSGPARSPTIPSPSRTGRVAARGVSCRAAAASTESLNQHRW